MRVRGSTTGYALAAIYLVAVAVAWTDFQRNRGQILADIWLVLLTFPYTFLGWALTGSSRHEVHASDPVVLTAAILLCTALVYLVGAGLGRLVRRVRRRTR